MCGLVRYAASCRVCQFAKVKTPDGDFRPYCGETALERVASVANQGPNAAQRGEITVFLKTNRLAKAAGKAAE